ncbi:MAG: TonB-dependent receptor plug domain-containing protein [Rhizomicrobium sp.]
MSAPFETVWAQAAGDAILVYPATSFAGVELNTAYDMIQRLPGFVFADTTPTQRGFAGTAGNVLVNGLRPTSKTDILSQVLQRIPASEVDSIQVIRGGAPGIDMQDLPVVANVILKRPDQNHVIATLFNSIFFDGELAPGGSVEFTGRTGANAYDLTLSRIAQDYDDSAGHGIRTLTIPGQGILMDAAHRRGIEKVGWGLNGSLNRPLFGGDFGTNLTLQQTIYNSDISYDPPDAVDFPASAKVRSAELGANWDHAFGQVELNLVALQRLERDQNFNASIASNTHQVFNSVSDLGESILRGTARWVQSQTLMIESGLEGVYNTLEGHSSFIANGTSVELPGANPKVNEKRGEISALATWRPLPDWQVIAGSRFEFSTIEAQGTPSRSFAFLKPRLLLSWAPIADMQIRARAEKLVGQLDFSNFIASSSFATNGVSAGNLQLKPDSRWQFEGDYEFHFWGKGAIVLTYMRENITDLVDYIPIGNGLDGPGNIPKASNNFYDFELSLPTDQLGVAGGTIKPSFVWRDGHVRDPVTGIERAISGVQDRAINIDFLEDIPSWHSSIDLAIGGAWQKSFFRIAQVQHNRFSPAYVFLSWDYQPKPDLDFVIKLENIVPYNWDIIQDNYAGPRNISPLVSIQDAHIRSTAGVYVQLRKTL